MKKSYDRVLTAAYSMPWAIQPEKLQAILAFLALKATGQAPHAADVAEIHAASLVAAQRADALASAGAGSVAVLPLFGLISHRASMMGDISGPRGTSTDKFTAAFRQAVNDPNCKAIVIDVDSPGGTVEGVPELADEIYRARGKKPITAVADCLMASAAYWISAAASELVCSPSSMVGSIGVYSAHEDDSQMLEAEGVKITLISAGKYKTEGNPYEPLGDEAQSAMQSMVDEFYGMFVKSVAKGRAVKVEDVRAGFGEGRVVTAQQAVKLGMADRIATLDQVLSKYGVSRGNATAMSPGVAISAAAKPGKADDMDCECECEACMEGECSACTHADCTCAGCTCEQAAAAKTKALSAMRTQADLNQMRDRINLASF
jgi:signal peptide peptidase SppA